MSSAIVLNISLLYILSIWMPVQLNMKIVREKSNFVMILSSRQFIRSDSRLQKKKDRKVVLFIYPQTCSFTR
jgi:hypothetical protein